MHIVHISWETSYRPTGWSLGYCSSCQQEGAVRLQNVVDILYLCSIIPLSESFKGKVARCDFCRRSVETVRDWEGIALADWSPQEGLASLGKKLGASSAVGGANASSDARLRSLLSSLRQSSSVMSVGLGPIGPLCGCIVGVLVAIPLAVWLHRNQNAPPQMDELGFVFLLSFISLFPGAILGALIEALRRSQHDAASRLREVYRDYPFDLYRLEELSREYGKNVHKIVKAVLDEPLRGL
ncbi:MAG TPA: hypothetical protein VH682_00970 [Gemmataceae bacterium]